MSDFVRAFVELHFQTSRRRKQIKQYNPEEKKKREMV